MLGRTKMSVRGIVYSLKRLDMEGIVEDIKDLLYFNIYYATLELYITIKRMLYWGYSLRNSHDFDSHYLYQIIHLKLERIYKEFKINSHCFWNETGETKGMKRLKETSELAKRLFERDEPNHYVSKIMDKYTCPTNKSSKSIFRQLGLKSKINNIEISDKLYSYYFKKACEKDKSVDEQLKSRFFMLLEKNINIWWD